MYPELSNQEVERAKEEILNWSTTRQALSEHASSGLLMKRRLPATERSPNTYSKNLPGRKTNAHESQ